ncbi:arylamine N-acetyltransferase family protein [Flagellimonas flava]|uniref:N-hydroxyarylamine O-acetyltransferase n=1 Tax=Flagellimonas flava TaxID=570519 RepID=A0A1M5HUE8_9FLAO|nr:arylamine N-acetyltransferase [Allomuricauda flava]SHG19579.1 N-hydroxyarylamine O-acetyltransferase [Allomuricauda flava]
MIDTKKYLQRINYAQPIKVTRDTLFQLQRAHLLSVPFENLDIHYGIPITLDTNSFFYKIVESGRGGFCYELNGLFNQLLNELGFKSRLISARTYGKDNSYSPEYDHLVLLVTLENQDFLVDVGFGKFSLHPLPITFGEVISDRYGQFSFDHYNSSYIRVNEIQNDLVSPQYIFSTQERELIEFKARCKYHQSCKESHFTQKKVISIAKENGRVTLNNTQLKISQSGKERLIEFNEEEFESKLKEYFHIELGTNDSKNLGRTN